MSGKTDGRLKATQDPQAGRAARTSSTSILTTALPEAGQVQSKVATLNSWRSFRPLRKAGSQER